MPKDGAQKDIVDFIHDLNFQDIPKATQDMAELCVLDLIGVGIGGATSSLSAIIRDHATEMFAAGSSTARLLFDGRSVSPAGAALAGGMTIDALDGHDGYNEAKGHVGCGVFPADLAFAEATGLEDGQAFLSDITLGYELGSRLAVALHATVPDYHTSGAWVAVAVAAIGARRLGLGREATRHALGIAEYHGPRSQMMRCIDHPTMLKDGSGFGAMAGVSASYLAASGFTGAPAITMEGAEAAPYWTDLGQRWLTSEQYFKPYPVCRWAQGPIEAVLSLKRAHNLTSEMVERIDIHTFHESVRLAVKAPKTTEEAQYSTSYPCAVALVKGDVGINEVSGTALNDPEIMRLSRGLQMFEDETCNAAFPAQRYAKAQLHMKDGRLLTSDIMNPRWTADEPPSSTELRSKFHTLADPLIGIDRAAGIEAATSALKSGGSVQTLADLICRSNDHKTETA